MSKTVMSWEDFLRSTEKVNKEEDNKEKTVSKQNKENYIKTEDIKKHEKNNVVSKLKELPGKASNISKQCKLWARGRKNLSFYKKYLDRVKSGLYDKYGGEAQVLENEMIDDPVSILKGPAKQYIHDIVKDINKLYLELSDLAKKLESKTTAEQCIMVVESYCKDYVGQKKDGKNRKDEKTSWKTRIDEATKYKIARILLRNGDRSVYGYTSKNMVLKGFPTPNHLIVTMFVNNPQENPQVQPVTNIFTSVDSFEILASSDKEDVFNVSNMNKAVLEKTADDKILNDIARFRQTAISHFKSSSIDDKKENGRIIDQIWDGIKISMKELLSKKTYLIDCINVYFDMVLRIDKLAVMAIKDLLAVENKYRDVKYDKSLRVKHSSDVGNLEDRRDNRDTNPGNLDKDKLREMRHTAKMINR